MSAVPAERDRTVLDQLTSLVSGAPDLVARSGAGRLTNVKVHTAAARVRDGWEDACATGLENRALVL